MGNLKKIQKKQEHLRSQNNELWQLFTEHLIVRKTSLRETAEQSCSRHENLSRHSWCPRWRRLLLHTALLTSPWHCECKYIGKLVTNANATLSRRWLSPRHGTTEHTTSDVNHIRFAPHTPTPELDMPNFINSPSVATSTLSNETVLVFALTVLFWYDWSKHITFNTTLRCASTNYRNH